MQSTELNSHFSEGHHEIGPVWVRCSFSVLLAKAEGAGSCDINVVNGPFLLVKRESVLREGGVWAGQIS